jgi:tetratricopeptide (TPR) repeat protein
MPDNPHFIREEANWRYWHKKELAKAYELLQSAQKLTPDDRYTVQMLSVTARGLGKITEAIGWYEKLLPLSEEKALPLYRLGVLHYQEKDYERAQERFAQYIKLEGIKKELAEAMRLSGYILVVKEKNYSLFAEQIKPYLNQLLYWRSQRNILAYYTGVALGMSGDKKEALRWLNTAKSWGYPHKESLDYYVKLFQ